MRFRKTPRFLALAAVAATLVAAGCTGEDVAGTGNFTLSLSGGVALKEGFPHEEGSVTRAFTDGWTLEFTKWVVAVANVSLTDPSDGGEVGSWKGPAVADLMKESTATKDLHTFEDLPALRLDIAYDLPAVTAGTTNLGVDQTDLDAMVKGGWSLLAAGKAEKAGQTVKFSFGLPVAARYSKCINGLDQKQGIAVEADKTSIAYIYTHAIHMFWDTLATGDEDLRFDPFAAVRGSDDTVTADELKQQDLNALKDETGAPLKDQSGNLVFYNDNGKLKPGQQTLYHFVLEAMKASAHFNGVGLCSHKDL